MASVMSYRALVRLAAALAISAALFPAPARAQTGAGKAPRAAAPGKALTVERIWGQPSLSGAPTAGLQWSPDGKLLAYTQRGEGRGARTGIWVIEAATGQRRVLLDGEKIAAVVASAEDRASVATGLGRAAPQRFIWAPTGNGLLYVSGGNLYWFDLATQAGKALTSSGPKRPAEDPKISPDGKWVSFVRDYDLWVVHLATGQESPVTRYGSEEIMHAKLDWVYPEELGIRTAYWWSPDSTRLAFLEMDQRPVTRYPLVNLLSYTGETEWMRYPKAGDANPIVRVGVAPVAGGEPQWMDLYGSSAGAADAADTYIPRVLWMPDAKHLSIQRLNRAQNKLELMFFDAASGRGRVVLAEEDKHFVNVGNELHFFSNGQGFLWSSERSGFRHLYIYDIEGKLLGQPTSGNWEVLSVLAVKEDPAGSAIFFMGTEKSPLERHFYRVTHGQGPPVRITQAEGGHAVNLAPGARHFVDSYSNPMTPARQDLYRIDGTRVAVINENKVAELAEYGLMRPQYGAIPDGRGGTLSTMMIKPPGFDPKKKYPALMYTYGGPSSQVVTKSWGGNNFLWHQMMAQKGFVIFLADNGGSAGRGHGSETPMYRNLGEVEVAEQVTAAKWLAAQPYIDGKRIGIWGWSYGGYMTCMLMLKTPGVWKAGFAGAPVTDWRQYDTIYTERYMGTPQNNAEGYAQSAPGAYAAKLEGQLLIAHGTGDDNVHYANTVKLQEELIKAGKYAEIVLYPGRGHGVGDSPARRHLFARVTQFFLEALRP